MTLQYILEQCHKKVEVTQSYLKCLEKTPMEAITSEFISENLKQIDKYLNLIGERNEENGQAKADSREETADVSDTSGAVPEV